MTLLDSPNAALLRRSCSAHGEAAGDCAACARVAALLAQPLPDAAFAERVADRIGAYFAFLTLEGLTPEEDECDVAEMYEDAIADALTEEADAPTPGERERRRDEAYSARSYAIKAVPDEDEPPAPKPPRKRWRPTGRKVGRPRNVVQKGWWGLSRTFKPRPRPRQKKKLPAAPKPPRAPRAAGGGTR
jgi:hypothetical protein